MGGPLSGFRIIEVGGQGTVPFAGMLLADMGAEMIRLERLEAVPDVAPAGHHLDVKMRGRRSVAVDLKHRLGTELFLDLVDGADALLEGYRPGVMERLGVGPSQCLDRNSRLVYGRVTGWGQDGPWAQRPGHDVNYVAFAGALAQFRPGPGQKPVPPLNFAGDLAGGGMLLAFGIACGLIETQRSGEGQVVDAAMIDGISMLMATFWGYSMMGKYDEERPGSHFFDLGAHFYNLYRCRDGEYLSIGCQEAKFYEALLHVTGLAKDPEFADQWDRSAWPGLTRRLEEVFLTRTRDEWAASMEGTDVCFSPVQMLREAAAHPHAAARGMYVDVDGVPQPAPAPRFSRTVPSIKRPPSISGADTRVALADWGVAPERIESLLAAGAVAEFADRPPG